MPDATPDTLADAFALYGETCEVRGGESIETVGDPAERLYRLAAGRIAALDERPGAPARLAEVHRPGAIIGSRTFLGDSRHPYTLTAMRDSVLHVLPRSLLGPWLRSQPLLMGDLAQTALAGVEPDPVRGRRGASVLGLIAVCESVEMRFLAEALAEAMRAHGLRIAVLGAEFGGEPSGRLSAIEAEHDVVLLAAERRDADFTYYCGRQIDRLILVGSAHSPLPDGPLAFTAAAIQRHRLLDFILIQPSTADQPRDSARWLRAAPVSRLFQIRRGVATDVARVARALVGRSVGLVLSGGGARAYAHVGVLFALRELGITPDFIAGTSMGAVIAAGVAMGWSLEELDHRIRDAFVNSSPLSDIAFPFLAMTRGSEVDRRLARHFGEVDIADLWLPFFCVSTNLTTGLLFEHREGSVRRALRASISIPGVLPPVVDGDQVLVDGALVRNLPVDLMRERHDGLIVGVDVAQAAGLTPSELALDPPGLRWLTSGAWLKGPPIVSVLIRAATLPGARLIAMGIGNTADLVITPELSGIGLGDWKAYEPAKATGYRAVMDQASAFRSAMSRQTLPT